MANDRLGPSLRMCREHKRLLSRIRGELFSDVVQARMAYRMLGSHGEAVASWEQVYILRKSDGRWGVSLTIANDEMAAWAAAGARIQ